MTKQRRGNGSQPTTEQSKINGANTHSPKGPPKVDSLGKSQWHSDADGRADSENSEKDHMDSADINACNEGDRKVKEEPGLGQDPGMSTREISSDEPVQRLMHRLNQEVLSMRIEVGCDSLSASLKFGAKKDSMPYSMKPLNPATDRLCQLCGPPFQNLTEAQLDQLPVCSFECGKRYVQEHLALSHGCRVKHECVKTFPDTPDGITTPVLFH